MLFFQYLSIALGYAVRSGMEPPLSAFTGQNITHGTEREEISLTLDGQCEKSWQKCSSMKKEESGDKAGIPSQEIYFALFSAMKGQK